MAICRKHGYYDVLKDAVNQGCPFCFSDDVKNSRGPFSDDVKPESMAMFDAASKGLGVTHVHLDALYGTAPAMAAICKPDPMTGPPLRGTEITVLPTEAKARKAVPLARGMLDYFPRACAAVAELSRIGNDQHNPGQPMHWAKEKSVDHADCILRHLTERGTIDTDNVRHAAKVAWRALAMLEIELQAEAGDPEAVRQFNEYGKRSPG